jgi:copper chaperone
MSCGHCELSVQEALDDLDGVERAKADHTKGEVELTYDADRVTEEELREAIEEAATRYSVDLRKPRVLKPGISLDFSVRLRGVSLRDDDAGHPGAVRLAHAQEVAVHAHLVADLRCAAQSA